MHSCNNVITGNVLWFLLVVITYSEISSQALASMQIPSSSSTSNGAEASPHEKANEAAMDAFDDKDETSGVVKRAWDRLQAGWGKRGWQNLQSGWGKRNFGVEQLPFERYYSGDKRGWQNLQGGWGKRAAVTDRQWETDSDLDELYSGVQQQLGEYYEPSLIRSGMAMADNDYIDEDKRNWRNLNSAWGKRDAKWGKFKGSWGKREPAWNNLKGLWG